MCVGVSGDVPWSSSTSNQPFRRRSSHVSISALSSTHLACALAIALATTPATALAIALVLHAPRPPVVHLSSHLLETAGLARSKLDASAGDLAPLLHREGHVRLALHVQNKQRIVHE